MTTGPKGEDLITEKLSTKDNNIAIKYFNFKASDQRTFALANPPTNNQTNKLTIKTRATNANAPSQTLIFISLQLPIYAAAAC
jgi:hypothetical protein